MGLAKSLLTNWLSLKAKRISGQRGKKRVKKKNKQQKRAADAFVTFTYLYNVVLRFFLS